MDQKQWQKAFPEPPQRFHEKMEATLSSLPQAKEKKRMGIKKRFLVPVIALVAVLALGTGLLATGTITSIVGHSSAKPTYTSLPSAETLQNDLEYTPNLPSEFSNGYTFETATVGTVQGEDENGNALDKHKNIGCLYKNGNEEINLYADKWNTPLEENSAVTETYQDIALYYTAYANKIVPGDYELTAQDKADEASGKYIFSFGSDEVEINQVQSVAWVQDGITYNLLGIDSNLAQGDLMAMAKEIINN